MSAEVNSEYRSETFSCLYMGATFLLDTGICRLRSIECSRVEKRIEVELGRRCCRSHLPFESSNVHIMGAVVSFEERLHHWK